MFDYLGEYLAGLLPYAIATLILLFVCGLGGMVGAYLLLLRREAEPSAAGYFKWVCVLGGTPFAFVIIMVTLLRAVAATLGLDSGSAG